MDIKKALNILEIENTDIDYKFLKKRYHTFALRYHPDKNDNLPESCEKFQKINEAYHFLCKELNLIDENQNINEQDCDTSNKKKEGSTIYMDLLSVFMMGLMDGKYNDLIFKIIKDIVIDYKKISLKLFENLDRETSVKIYSFLSKHKKTFHLNDLILEEVREIVQQKYTNVLVYKLNPGINDLINNNIFKLNVFGKICFVPLWMNESYFEILEYEVIVLCEPELPEDIRIDEYNNLHIKKIVMMDEIIDAFKNDLSIKLNIGEKVFEIPLNELKLVKEQIFVIKNNGLLKMEDIELDLNLSKKADIIVKIIIQ
jgi:hypothetical protein